MHIMFPEDPKRKCLVTGSIPTEKLPQKSHQVATKTRRTLVRHVKEPEENMLSTSGQMFQSLEEFQSVEDFTIQLDNEELLPWTVETKDTDIRFQLQ